MININVVYYSKRHLARCLLIIVILSAAVGIFRSSVRLTVEDVVSVLVAEAKLHPIYAVDIKEKKVAISFDATWGSTRTPQILQILAKHNIRTTFFLTNIWLNEYPHLGKEIVACGHEAALHTATHPRLTELPDEKIRQELQENASLIKDITGQYPVLFRPPFGAYNNRVIKIIKEENFIPIQWSVDSLDWKDLSADAMFRRVTQRIHPGAIVLFHNDGANTPQALEPILEYLKNEGYTVVPVSELIFKDNYYIDVNGIQKGKKDG